MTQLETALNEQLNRLRGIRYCGIWDEDGSCCLNDDAAAIPTSFRWHRGETLGAALDRLHSRFKSVQSVKSVQSLQPDPKDVIDQID